MMSDFFKVFLVLLYAAVAVDAVKLFLAKTPVSVWLESEHFLFVPLAEKKREKAAEPLALTTLYCMYMFSTPILLFCALSGVSEELPIWEIAEYSFITLFAAAKILFATRYNGKQLMILTVFMSYFALEQVICGFNAVGKGAVLMVLLKDVNVKKALRAVAAFLFIEVFVSAVLSLSGLIPLMIRIEDDGRWRADLGMGSYNALGIVAAEAVILFVLTRKNKLKWYHVATVAVSAIFIYIVPNSRSSLALMFLILVGCAAAMLVPQLFENKAIKVLCCLPAPMIASAMWILHFVYNKDNKLMLFMDKVLTGRLSLAYITWTEEREAQKIFPFLGRYFDSRFNRIDDSYIYYAYLCGPLMAIALVAAFVLLTHKLLKMKQYTAAICVISFACYACMERCISGINFSLLFMPALLFGETAFVWPSLVEKEEGRPKT